MWIYTKKLLDYSENTDFGVGTGYKEYYKYVLLSEGSYKNSIKIGIWKYYDFFGYEQGDIEKTVTYLDNGNKIEEHFRNKYKIEINSDTTFVIGTKIIDNDTVNILCKGNNCNFSINGNEFLTFTKDMFEEKFYELIIGMYNREIFLNKTK